MRRMALTALTVALAAVLSISGGAGAAAGPDAAASAPAAKLKNGLDRLVADVHLLDPRIPGLINGYVNREIPAFALLSHTPDAGRRAQIQARGGRILRV